MILKIAERIKELREWNNLTQSEFARKLHLSRTSINAWEMGISIPATSKIPDICRILHTNADYLLGISYDDSIPLNLYTSEEKDLLYKIVQYFENNHTNEKRVRG